jgi:hypothetical protein
MTLLAALLLGLSSSYEPACLQALQAFEDSPPAGAACLASVWSEDRGWTPVEGPAMGPDGLQDASGAWDGRIDKGCALAARVLDSRGIYSFACLGQEGAEKT